METISQIQSLYTELFPSAEKEILISKEKLKILLYIYSITLVIFGYIAFKVFPLMSDGSFIWVGIFLLLQILIFSSDIFSKIRNIKKDIFYFEEIRRFYNFIIERHVSEFTQILDASERMYELLSYSKESHRLLKFVLITNNPLESEIFYHKLIKYLFIILLNLRSDLVLRLEEQQKNLEQVKSEVEENITGTSEFEQVSELQKARLDRQIEQFEELQRILVT